MPFTIILVMEQKLTDVHRKTGCATGNRRNRLDPTQERWKLFTDKKFTIPLVGWDNTEKCLKYIISQQCEETHDQDKIRTTFYDQAVS